MNCDERKENYVKGRSWTSWSPQGLRKTSIKMTLNLPHKESVTESTTTFIQGHVCALEARYLINKFLSFLDPRYLSQ